MRPFDLFFFKCLREHYWKYSSFLVIVSFEKWTFCTSSFIKYMCMSRTLVNMLKCPGTQMKVEELGHLWLRMLHGAFEAFVQPGSKWLRRQPSQWIINTKAKLGFHAASCVIVEIIWSCVIWFDWHPVRRTQTEVKRELRRTVCAFVLIVSAVILDRRRPLLTGLFLTLPCLTVTHKTRRSFKKKVQIMGTKTEMWHECHWPTTTKAFVDKKKASEEEGKNGLQNMSTVERRWWMENETKPKKSCCHHTQFSKRQPVRAQSAG